MSQLPTTTEELAEEQELRKFFADLIVPPTPTTIRKPAADVRPARIHIRWAFEGDGLITYEGWDVALRRITDLVHPFETLRIRIPSAVAIAEHRLSAAVTSCDVVIDVLPMVGAPHPRRPRRLPTCIIIDGVRILE